MGIHSTLASPATFPRKLTRTYSFPRSFFFSFSLRFPFPWLLLPLLVPPSAAVTVVAVVLMLLPAVS